MKIEAANPSASALYSCTIYESMSNSGITMFWSVLAMCDSWSLASFLHWKADCKLNLWKDFTVLKEKLKE